MRRGVVAGVVLGVVVVCAGVAVVVYRSLAPGMLASGYEKRAEPEHERARQLADPVELTFDDRTLGTEVISSKKSSTEWLRLARRHQIADMRELSKAKRAVRKARRKLKALDAEAMTDVPSWPLVGGRGELKEAEAIAAAERDYLRLLREYLRDYDELLDYTTRFFTLSYRAGVAFTKVDTEIPAQPTSAGQITGPLDRSVRATAAILQQLERLRAPKPVRDEHRDVVRELDFFVTQQRATSAAVKRNDFAAVNRIYRRTRRVQKRANRQAFKDMDRLLYKSRYRKQLDELGDLERKLDELYRKL